jgi:hypothetical protein
MELKIVYQSLLDFGLRAHTTIKARDIFLHRVKRSASGTHWCTQCIIGVFSTLHLRYDNFVVLFASRVHLSN